MARGEIEALVAGGRHRLFMPLGAMDDVARVCPELVGLLERLSRRPLPSSVTWAEARAVVDAGIRHGRATVTVDEIYRVDGLARVYGLAAELMLAAFEAPEPGKENAGGTDAPPPASTSTGSSPPGPSSA